MKIAVCIGINYLGTSNELGGCIIDAKNIKKYLMECQGYKEEDILLLTEESPKDSTLYPVRKNIWNALAWMMQKIRNCPEKETCDAFLDYSGHGSNRYDYDGDEDDGRDETIVALDGQITDDEIKEQFLIPLHNIKNVNCNLFMLIDACHSGTFSDLPYALSRRSQWKKNVKYDNISKSSNINVIQISGCKDNQYSTDLGSLGGALTYSFCKILKKYKDRSDIPTWVQLLYGIRAKVKWANQIPQLSATHPFHINDDFLCFRTSKSIKKKLNTDKKEKKKIEKVEKKIEKEEKKIEKEEKKIEKCNHGKCPYKHLAKIHKKVHHKKGFIQCPFYNQQEVKNSKLNPVINIFMDH